MYSVYTQAYNVRKYNIDVFGAIHNFLKFLDEDDEIIIAYNSIYERLECDEDYKELKKQVAAAEKLAKESKQNIAKVTIIHTKYTYDDVEFDGKVKNAALQATVNPIKVQMDIDERFNLKQKAMWGMIAQDMVADKRDVFCYLIPTVDLWGNIDTIRKNVKIGTKFRIHKGMCKRGVPHWGYNEDGSLDTSKTDTTEPIDSNGNLIDTSQIVPPMLMEPNMADRIPIYTIHLGFLDFKYRENIDRFWNPHWKLRSGNKKEDPKHTQQSLGKEEVIKHNLDFEL